MVEGPEQPVRRDETEVEAARRVVMREIVQTRQTVVTAIAIATLLILVAIGYQRCSDPWWRCKRMADKESEGKLLSDEESDTWADLGCSDWPGI